MAQCIVECVFCRTGIKIVNLGDWWGIPVCGECLKFYGPPFIVEDETDNSEAKADNSSV